MKRKMKTSKNKIKERIESIVLCTTRHYVKEWLPIRKAIDGDCVCKGLLTNGQEIRGYIVSGDLCIDYRR